MLIISDLDAFYGQSQVLRSFSLDLEKGEVLGLLGRNGAGKTTAMKSIMGLIRQRRGRMSLNGTDLMALPANEVPKQGIGYVPQGRRLFSDLTVRENLEIGMLTRRSDPGVLDEVLDLFPILRTRLDQKSVTLSGGEQTMLAMGRALCLEPAVLLLDEPTEGLMPTMIAKIRDTVAHLRRREVSTILVEQRVDMVLPVADRVAFIEGGAIRATVSAATLREDPTLLEKYIGVSY